MTSSVKIHYCGGLIYASGREGSTEMLSGWAACCTGPAAYKIQKAGLQTYDREKVTCPKCLELFKLELGPNGEYRVRARRYLAQTAVEKARSRLRAAEDYLATLSPVPPPPSFGVKTHPLTPHALDALVDLHELGAKPAQELNSGLINRLLRESLIVLEERLSPYRSHKAGTKIQRVVLTAEGKARADQHAHDLRGKR